MHEKREEPTQARFGRRMHQVPQPHQAKLAKLLLAQGPTFAFPAQDVEGKDAEGENALAAARDCLRCHAPHGSGQGILLAKPVASLCVECHDGRAVVLEGSHRHPAPAMDCKAAMNPMPRRTEFFKEKLHARSPAVLRGLPHRRKAIKEKV